MNIYEALKQPFPENDIEWRVSRSGMKGDTPWAKVLAYVTSRAIMDRLDDVVGAENWQTKFENIGGAFLCTISIRIDGEWISKQDGAQETNIEATKGGISGALKRAGVQWGIGRYLYNLEEGWAELAARGRYYSPKTQKMPAFNWNPPRLPNWALPDVEKKPDTVQAAPPVEKELTEEQLAYKNIALDIVAAQTVEDAGKVWSENMDLIAQMPPEGQRELSKKLDARLEQIVMKEMEKD